MPLPFRVLHTHVKNGKFCFCSPRFDWSSWRQHTSFSISALVSNRNPLATSLACMSNTISLFIKSDNSFGQLWTRVYLEPPPRKKTKFPLRRWHIFLNLASLASCSQKQFSVSNQIFPCFHILNGCFYRSASNNKTLVCFFSFVSLFKLDHPI